MEPILELATQITSQLWLFHELFPNQGNVGEVLRMNWRSKLEEQAARDYSRLQALLDLTGQTEEGDWDPNDPLRRFGLSDQREEKFNWRDPFELLRIRQANLKHRQEESAQRQIRSKAAVKSLSTIGVRVDALLAQGISSEVDFIPAWLQQNKAPQVNPTGPHLLTREELFEKTANWLLASPPSKVSSLAESFTSAEDFLMHGEITGRAKVIAAQADDPRRGLAEDWLRKESHEKLDILLDSNRLSDQCRTFDVPVPFSMVIVDELREIGLSRLVRLYGKDYGEISQENMPDSGVECGIGLPQQRAFRSCLFGLALSGGGIRSATFSLGLLQGMADRNILPYIDLISTVSGGGYIGSWLISWIKRRGGVESVQNSMRGSASLLRLSSDCPARRPVKASPDLTDPLATITHNSDPHSDHVRPIRLLREYSRYLAPQAGAFSADSWTIATTWLRNTLLNLTVLLLFFGAALLVPRLLIFVLLHLRVFAVQSASPTRIIASIVIASIPLLIGCWMIGTRNLRTFGPYQWQKNQECRGNTDTGVVGTIIPWILLGAFLEVAMLWHLIGGDSRLRPWVARGFAAIVVVGISILAAYLKPWNRKKIPGAPVEPRLTMLARLIAMTGSAISGWALIFWLSKELNKFGENTERGLWIAGSLGVALMLLVVVSVVGVFQGLAGKALSDEQREWWSRLGAWFGLVIVSWLVLCAVCFFMPLWLAMLGLKVAAAGIGWAAITSAGVKIAFSAKSGRDSAAHQNWLYSLVLKLAPPVFVLGVLSIVSFALFWIIQRVVDTYPSLFAGDTLAHQLCCTNLPISFHTMEENYWPLMYPGSIAPLCLMVGLTLLCLLVAWRVDINEFSMHHFYKNRLVRAYLGSSRARSHRFPNAFTGFDLEDDIRLRRFTFYDQTQSRDMAMDCKASYAGPYPIINTAVNITRGADLGIQERKAESFVFTPLWSGFDFSHRQIAVKKTTLSEYAFQRTDRFGEPDNGGAQLGTAMAISGAAFNSNAGFHTSPALAFLLTVFGVRLGWWAGNPRGTKWQKASPGLGLLYLIKELTAETSTGSPFVLLSDGGHFENMALYELIRRRCRYIVLSDAEEDETFKLQGIGGAIRKCRDDFGVVIDLNIEALQPIGDPAASRLHYSLGTIIYPGEKDCGKLLYIKSSLTGDEPVDVIEFRKRHSEFPHTSTVDQFFDESHFESYRALGHHIASEVFSLDMPKLPLDVEESACEYLKMLFDRIEKDWQERLKSAPKDTDESLKAVTQAQDKEKGPQP